MQYIHGIHFLLLQRKASVDEAAKDLLDLVIRVASGEQTKAEKHGFREISIFKDGVVL